MDEKDVRVEPNDLLRAARQSTPSHASPGFALSRSELAELVNESVYRATGRLAAVDGHYVAKLERGIIRWPRADYRRAFREVLGASTEYQLGFRRPRRSDESAPPLPAPSLPGRETDRERLEWVRTGDHLVDDATVTYLRDVITAQWYLEDTVGSGRLLAVVQTEIELIEDLTWQARGRVHRALTTLVAECHEFAARMADYNGEGRTALHHGDRAWRAAHEVDDVNLVAGVHGLRAHLAWGMGDADGAITHANAGRDGARLSARTAAFMAQMEGRGHAQRSESAAAERLIDQAERLTHRAAEHPEDEPWWTYPQTPERILFQRGLAYLELGLHGAARDLISRAGEALPDRFRRDRGRFAAALAVACVEEGDVAGAVSAARSALAIAKDAGSVYTVADLRRVFVVLQRQRHDPDTLQGIEVPLQRFSRDGAPR